MSAKPCFQIRTNAWRKANPEAAKKITRRSQLKSAYGITEAEWDRLFANQGGTCAICHRVDDGSAAGRRLHVDHCHDTGRVRGLLCNGCNNGIGRFNHDPALLRNAIEYLVELRDAVGLEEERESS